MKVWLGTVTPDGELPERQASSDGDLAEETVDPAGDLPEGTVSPDGDLGEETVDPGGDPIVGQAIDLRDTSVDAQRVLAGIRDSESETVVGPPPTAVHEHIGHIHEDMALDRREALIAAARSRGLQAPQDPEIERLDRRIAAITHEDPDLRAAWERAAEAGESVEALRERVARLSGRLTEARETGRETADLAADLQTEIRELSEDETEAAAARQALDPVGDPGAGRHRLRSRYPGEGGEDGDDTQPACPPAWGSPA